MPRARRYNPQADVAGDGPGAGSGAHYTTDSSMQPQPPWPYPPQQQQQQKQPQEHPPPPPLPGQEQQQQQQQEQEHAQGQGQGQVQPMYYDLAQYGGQYGAPQPHAHQAQQQQQQQGGAPTPENQGAPTGAAAAAADAYPHPPPLPHAPVQPYQPGYPQGGGGGGGGGGGVAPPQMQHQGDAAAYHGGAQAAQYHPHPQAAQQQQHGQEQHQRYGHQPPAPYAQDPVQYAQQQQQQQHHGAGQYHQYHEQHPHVQGHPHAPPPHQQQLAHQGGAHRHHPSMRGSGGYVDAGAHAHAAGGGVAAGATTTANNARRKPGRSKSVSPSEAWELRFRELKAFRAEFGHSDVPQTYKKNRTLGKWVGKQREHWKALQESGSSPLTEERIRKLQSLDFRFFVGKGQHAKIHGLFMTDNQIESWDAKFRALEEFKEIHGHCEVPARYPANRNLASWAMLQRRKFNEFDMKRGGTGSSGAGGANNDRTVMTKELRLLEERRKRLADLGFNFGVNVRVERKSDRAPRPRRSHEDAWNEKLEELSAYKETHGNADVPITSKDHKALAIWVSKQREMWRNKKAGKGRIISDDREKKLSDLGFTFEAWEALWTVKFQELAEYKKKYGTADVKNENNRKLWHWCKRQREAFKEYLEEGERAAGGMSNERIAKMEELGFDWKYEDVRKLMKKREQRTKGKGGTSEEPEKKKKKKVGRPRKNPPPEEAADVTSTAAAAAFANDEGSRAAAGHQLRTEDLVEDGKMPAGEHAMPSDFDAAATAALEIAAAEAALAKASKRYGNEVGPDGGTTNIKPEKWLGMYQELINYKKDHGDCRVPTRSEDYNRLGPWVKMQREDLRKMNENKYSPMCQWRIDLLEKIGFEFKINQRNPVSFEQRFAELQEFKDEFGHCNVPQGWARNIPLGKWVSKTRDNYRFLQEGKKSRLNHDQIAQLESVGFCWFVGRGKGLRTWDMYFQDLRKFKAAHGHFNVPLNYEDNPALATWAQQQRINYKNEQMGKCKYSRRVIEHNRRLEGIGFNFHAGGDYLESPVTKKKTKGGRKRGSKEEDKKRKANGTEDEEEDDEEKTPAKRQKSDSIDDAVGAAGGDSGTTDSVFAYGSGDAPAESEEEMIAI